MEEGGRYYVGQKDEDTTEIKSIGMLGCISVYRWNGYTGLTIWHTECDANIYLFGKVQLNSTKCRISN